MKQSCQALAGIYLRLIIPEHLFNFSIMIYSSRINHIHTPTVSQQQTAWIWTVFTPTATPSGLIDVQSIWENLSRNTNNLPLRILLLCLPRKAWRGLGPLWGWLGPRNRSACTASLNHTLKSFRQHCERWTYYGSNQREKLYLPFGSG